MIPGILFEKISSSEVVLFLGAGASKSSGGPIGSELAEYIETKLMTNEDTSDLSVYTQSILKSKLATRKEIENHIKERLEKLNPSKGYTDMTCLPWKSIYSVNFDDLVEQAYQKSKGRYDLKVINKGNLYDDKENHQINLYKLNGSITDVFSEDKPLLITYDDLLNKDTFRVNMLKRLTASLHNTIIFIGYSFSDGVIEDILNEFKTSQNYSSIKQKFLVSPNQSKKDILKFDTIYDCKYIDLSADEFFRICKEKFEKDYKAQLDAFGKSLSFFNGESRIDFPASVKASINSYFDYYEEEENYPNDAEFFYRCGTPLWGNIINNLDVSRNILLNDKPMDSFELISSVFDNLKEEKMYLYKLTGPIAVGKTTLCYRLAFELYHKGVITLLTNKSETIRKNLISEIYKTLKKPFIIIVDDAVNYVSKINTIVNECMSHNIPISLILVARENDWELLTDKQFRRKIDGNITSIKIEDNLNEQQSIELANKLITNKVFNDTPEFTMKDLIKEFVKTKHLVVSLMSSIEKTGFEKKLIIDFDRMTTKSQQAYGMISLVNRLCLPFKWELLQRSLNDLFSLSWFEFIEEVVNLDAKGNILEYGSNGNLYYTCRHNFIANFISNVYYKYNRDEEIIAYKTIVRNVNASTNEELFIGKMIQYIISHQSDLSYSDTQLIELIDCTLKSVASKHFLLHIKGQFLMEKLNDYQGAIACFEKCIRDDENKEYALHSAGMAHFYISDSKTGENLRIFEINNAKKCMLDGMGINPQNNYFYLSYFKFIINEYSWNAHEREQLLREAKQVFENYQSKSTKDTDVESAYNMILSEVEEYK